jgi:hypothetical protein
LNENRILFGLSEPVPVLDLYRYRYFPSEELFYRNFPCLLTGTGTSASFKRKFFPSNWYRIQAWAARDPVPVSVSLPKTDCMLLIVPVPVPNDPSFNFSSKRICNQSEPVSVVCKADCKLLIVPVPVPTINYLNLPSKILCNRPVPVSVFV